MSEYNYNSEYKPNEIGRKIRELREHNRNITQKQCANELGWSTSQLCEIEKTGKPLTIIKLIELCFYFGVPADYILGLRTENTAIHVKMEKIQEQQTKLTERISDCASSIFSLSEKFQADLNHISNLLQEFQKQADTITSEIEKLNSDY